MRNSSEGASDLALEVDPPEGIGSGRFEELSRVAGQEDNRLVSLLEKLLAVVVNDKLSGLSIGFKCKLLSDITQFQVWFVTANGRQSTEQPNMVIGDGNDLRFAHGCESSQSLAFDKHVYEIGAHVRNIEVELKESVMVPKSQCGAHFQGMLNSPLFLVCCG